MDKICEKCAHALFQPLWGEYKCKKRERTIYSEVLACDDYQEGIPGIAKGEETNN